jgi:hypothetical protein
MGKKNKYLRDISLQTGIEHARGLIEAQAGQVPSFVSRSLLASTIEDTEIEGQVAHYEYQAHPCFVVRIPNPRNYSWFAHRFYVVFADVTGGYRCSARDERTAAAVIEQVKRFVASEEEQIAC